MEKQSLFEEIWRDVKDYEGLYQISNLGNVKSLGRIVECNLRSSYRVKEKILKPSLDARGYLSFHLSKNLKPKRARLHRLIAIAFIENPLNLEDVNHIDGDRTNNSLNNLEWVSRRENIHHMMLSNGFDSVGSSYHSKLKKWKSSITIEGKRIHLGWFSTKEEALSKYNEASKAYGVINKYHEQE